MGNNNLVLSHAYTFSGQSDYGVVHVNDLHNSISSYKDLPQTEDQRRYCIFLQLHFEYIESTSQFQWLNMNTMHVGFLNMFSYHVRSYFPMETAAASKKHNFLNKKNSNIDRQRILGGNHLWLTNINRKEAPAVIPWTDGSIIMENSKRHQDELKVLLPICPVFLKNQEWCWSLNSSTKKWCHKPIIECIHIQGVYAENIHTVLLCLAWLWLPNRSMGTQIINYQWYH